MASNISFRSQSPIQVDRVEHSDDYSSPIIPIKEKDCPSSTDSITQEVRKLGVGDSPQNERIETIRSSCLPFNPDQSTGEKRKGALLEKEQPLKKNPLLPSYKPSSQRISHLRLVVRTPSHRNSHTPPPQNYPIYKRKISDDLTTDT